MNTQRPQPKISKADQQVSRVMVAMVAVILVLVPFHAFLTVSASSLAGHYTLLRLWEEILLVLLGIGSLYILACDRLLRRKFTDSWIVRLIGLYALMQIIWGLGAFWLHDLTVKALGYGWIVDLRFVAFFVAVWLVASRSSWLQRTWKPLVFWPAGIVIVFGLLQYFALPYDFLRHFGYRSTTIYPYETINHNIDFIRIMSTLRGANPLGAYLVVIVSLAAAMWLKCRRWPYALLFVGGLFAMALSFSRSAWIGAFLSLLTLLFVSFKSKKSQQWLAIGIGVLLLIGMAGVLTLRHNAAFQNAFFHTQEHSAIKTSSNGGHITAFKESLHDLAHVPLGRGPGTAGPASVYNRDHPVRIAENYWVQVSQEIGWAGLAIFIAINLLVGRELWRRRGDPLALGLLAALIGVSFANLLSHAWADETLAFLWWGLAGLALAQGRASMKSRENFPETEVVGKREKS